MKAGDIPAILKACSDFVVTLELHPTGASYFVVLISLAVVVAIAVILARRGSVPDRDSGRHGGRRQKAQENQWIDRRDGRFAQAWRSKK